MFMSPGTLTLRLLNKGQLLLLRKKDLEQMNRGTATTLCPKVHVTSKPPLFSGIDAHIMKSFEVLNPQTGRFILVYDTW